MMLRLGVLLGILGWATTFCQAEELTRVTISGRVVDGGSRTVSGVLVQGVTYADQTESTTDEEGRFTLEVVEERVKSLTILAEDTVGDRMGVFRADWNNPPTRETPIEISLADTRHLPVEVLTAEGKPAAEVRVGAVISFAPLLHVVTDSAGKAVLKVPSDCELNSLYASKRAVGFDYRVVFTRRDPSYQAKWLDESPIRFQLAEAQTVRVRLLDTEEKPIVGTELSLWLLKKPTEPDSFNLSYAPTEFRIATNEKGVANFQGVPDWNVHPLVFWPRNDEYVRNRITYDPKEHREGQVTAKLPRVVPMSGRVRFADGRAAAGITVSIVGAGYQFDRFRKTIKTDRLGNFETRVTPNLLYVLGILDDQYAAPLLDGLVVYPNDPVERLEIELRPATRIHGLVTVGPESNPVEGQRVTLNQNGRSLGDLEGIELPNPEDKKTWISPGIYRSVMTDKEGQYEFFVGPGEYRLNGHPQVEAKKFEIADTTELEYNFPAPRAVDGPFVGLVVDDETGEPVPGAKVVGVYRSHYAQGQIRATTNEEGKFQITRELFRTVLSVNIEDRTRRGLIEIGEEQESATIRIAPVAHANGRLLDRETKQTLEGKTIQYGIRVYLGDEDAAWQTSFGGSVITDSEGKFSLKNLIVGQEYDLSVPRGDGTYGGLPKVTPERAETIELGDLKLSPPYKPPTFEERMEKNFVAEGTPIERYEQALEQTELLHQHVLVVFLEQENELAKSWFKLRLDDSEVRESLANYQLIHVAADADGATELAEKLGVDLYEEPLPRWWFGDISGEKLEAGSVPHLDGEIDKSKLLEHLANHAPESLDAREILREALAEAKKSDRLVIVQETATWCGPCHKLSKYLESQRSILEKDYLWIKIDQRWVNSSEVMEEIYPDKRGGIPWFAIIDYKKGLMATSDGPNGNIGFPSTEDEIEHFLTMLQSTMLRMSAEDLDTLRLGFESQ